MKVIPRFVVVVVALAVLAGCQYRFSFAPRIQLPRPTPDVVCQSLDCPPQP